jgi:conjugal transfer/entry exclusion protein
MKARMLVAMRETTIRFGLANVVMALGLCCISGQASAQFVVTDPGHTALTYSGWIKELISQGEQYAKQIEQYRTQVQQYETQIRQYEQQYIKGGIFNQAALATHQFTPRALDAGMSERCPPGLRSMLSSSASAENCAMIVQTENARYNAIVTVLNVSKQRDGELQKIYAERAGISQQDAGALQANNNRLLALQSRMQMDTQQARSQTEGYDRLLELLREDQQMVASGTLDGDGLVAGMVRGAALRAALNAARRSDR